MKRGHQKNKQTDKQKRIATTRPTRPRGPSWWKYNFPMQKLTKCLMLNFPSFSDNSGASKGEAGEGGRLPPHLCWVSQHACPVVQVWNTGQPIIHILLMIHFICPQKWLSIKVCNRFFTYLLSKLKFEEKKKPWNYQNVLKLPLNNSPFFF